MAYNLRNIKDWQSILGKIYHENNRISSIDKIWSRLIEETAEITTPIVREKQKEDLTETIPDILAWLFAFCNKTNINLEKITWERYKDGCPCCGEFKNCDKILLQRKKNYKKRQPLGHLTPHVPAYDRPKTLNKWQDLFYQLYGETNADLPEEFFLAKLIEDIGYVAKGLRQKKPQKSYYANLASIVAWTMAICNRVHIGQQLWLSDLMWEKYPDKCRRCDQITCLCITLQDIYIVYTKDALEEFRKVKKVIKKQKRNTLSRKTSSDEQILSRNELEKINAADAAIIIIGDNIDLVTYSEVILLFDRLRKDLIFVYVSSFSSLGEPFMPWLQELPNFNKFKNIGDISKLIKQDLKKIEGSYHIL